MAVLKEVNTGFSANFDSGERLFGPTPMKLTQCIEARIDLLPIAFINDSLAVDFTNKYHGIGLRKYPLRVLP